MKKIITVLCLILFVGVINAQQASDYFPAQTGFEWKFKVTPLDSGNIPNTSAAFYRMDFFASVADYNGKLANIVQTKTGPLQTIQSQPFLDSLFYNMEGTNGFEYLSISNIEPFLIALDSLGIDSTFNFLEFFTSLQDWYSNYRFASSLNSEYLLKQQDATISGIPIRFKYVGKRLQDQTIQTLLGSFDCKKFLIQWKVYAYNIIEVLTTSDTIWIAPGNWIVQDIVPANNVDLSLLGIPAFTIPGLETKLTNEIVTFVANEEAIPNTFSLEQNFPNPFNPTTKISWQSPVGSWQTLIVYDVLGKEVANLVDEFKPAGRYEVEFSAEGGLPSGIYFYKLQTESFVETKKMLLLK
jgi:hypothetical protein